MPGPRAGGLCGGKDRPSSPPHASHAPSRPSSIWRNAYRRHAHRRASAHARPARGRDTRSIAATRLLYSVPSTPSRSPRHEEPGGHLGRFHDLHAAEPAFLETALGFDDRRLTYAAKRARSAAMGTWPTGLGPLRARWLERAVGEVRRDYERGSRQRRAGAARARPSARPRWLTEALGEIPLRRA